MRIAIFQKDLNIGGIQRALIDWLKDESFKAHKVDLYLFSKENEYDISELPQNVEVKYLNVFPSAIKAVPFKLLMHFGRTKIADIANDYDVAIDFNGYSPECALYALSVKAKRKIIWIHNDYVQRIKYDKKFLLMYLAFKKKFFFFDQLVAVSQGVADSISDLEEIPKDRITIVPNIIDAEGIIKKASQSINFAPRKDRVNIVVVGRLDKTKNVVNTANKVVRAINSGANIDLYFIGSGRERSRLQRLISKKRLQDRIMLLGSINNPYPYMVKMDALLLNSLFEGQGLVLREAQCLGLKLMFPKRLEKYNDSLNGFESMQTALLEARKNKWRDYDLESLRVYNEKCRHGLCAVLKAGEKGNR